MSKILLSDIRVGDVFGESAYYKVLKINSNTIAFTHTKTGVEVELSNSYVTELLSTADQYQQEVSVGLLDKHWTAKQVEEQLKKNPKFSAVEGDLKQEGIKTIWANVGGKPFTVCFTKKGKQLSTKAFNAKIQEVVNNAIDQIEQAKTARKGVAKTAAQIVEELVRNPITDMEVGEERVLRGYKLQHESTDGFYQVVDMDITSGENKRLVNLNTIKWLVVDGTKYIVE